MASYQLEQTARMLEMRGAPLASFWRRGAAFILDIGIMSLLFAGVLQALAPLLLKRGWIQRSDRFSFALNIDLHHIAWVNWYSIAWLIVYFGLATWLGGGRTPGKWLMGIRVVSLAHERISLWHAVERALGYGASMLEFGFGFLQCFIHPNRRTVHDRIAETIVVREKKIVKGKRKKGKGKSKETDAAGQ